MKTEQKISRADLAKIYSQVCSTWQTNISKLLIEQQINKDIIVSNDLILKAYGEADDDKKKLITKYFKVDIQDNNLPKDWKGICKKLSIHPVNSLPYKNSKNTEQKVINASFKIFKIVEVYNNREKLDWKNTNVYKYCPYKYFSGGSWLVISSSWCVSLCSSGGFYYKTKELSDLAYKNFSDVYEEFWNVK